MGWPSRQDGGFFLSTVVPGGGVRVTRHPGIVHSEAVIGANIFRDFFSSVRDVVDGRAGGHERILLGSRDAAPDDLVAAAKECIADGPIGIDFDHEVLGEANDMMMVAVSGRAVNSRRTAHRLVGYFEEDAVLSYTQYLEEIDAGRSKNVAAPAIARRYWKLADDATLRDVVLVVRADEAHHRDVNHGLANQLSGQPADPAPVAPYPEHADPDR